MKKPINLTENDLKQIVENVVSTIIKEDIDPNKAIDEIGIKVEPMYQELRKLVYLYENYKGGFLGSVVEDLKVAYERLEHLMYIVNH